MLQEIASRFWVVGVFAAVLGVGCTKKDGSSQSSSSGVKVVNLAIWSNYISDDLIKNFEKQHGVKIQISNYSSNEELLAKLQAGASGYDVAVPSDYMVYAMSKLGLLQEIDRSQISNLQLIDARYLKKSFDPDNRYSVPYNWGTTGIAVNRDLFKGTIKSWKDFSEKATLAGKFSLLDDSRETIGAALKAQGFSLNSKNPDELQKAKGWLLKLRGRIKVFSSEPKTPLISGETAVAHAYTIDAFQAIRESKFKNIEYVIPEEGSTLWVDNLVVPKGALHPKEAHLLINFLLATPSAVSTSLNLQVAPANREVPALLPALMRENKGLFPPDSVLSKCEMIEDLGEAMVLWDRIWTEVKAHQD